MIARTHTQTRWVKDPGAKLDWSWDWTKWLAAENDVISDFAVTVPAGMTLDSSDEANGVVVAWLEGGTVGATYIVTCQVTTVQGRVDERSIVIDVADR